MSVADELEQIASKIEAHLVATAPEGPLVPAAVVECPACGRRREISARVVRAIASGKRDGVCPPGEGCRKAIDEDERMRRWWLDHAGVDRGAMLHAGGALEYVALHGLPDPLRSLL